MKKNENNLENVACIAEESSLDYMKNVCRLDEKRLFVVFSAFPNKGCMLF